MNVIEQRLASTLTLGWWRLLLRGLAAIAFGILAWCMPGITLATLVLLFGLYSLADGILATWTAIAGRKDHAGWWVLLLGGLVGIGVGIMTIASPGLTTLALLFYIAIWAVAKGVLEIMAAIRLRKEIEGEWLLILGGLASVLFGVFLMARPGEGALTIVWVIATYAVFFGIVMVALAFKARSFVKQVAGR